MRAADRRAAAAKSLVKICGIRTETEVALLNRLKPDFAGFVFAASRRRIEPEAAARLIGQLGFSIRPVGVFVDEAAERVAEIAHECGLHAVQLHGAETAGYVARLRTLLPNGVKIWKAVRMTAGTKPDAAGADLLLLDGAAPGAGRTFDWDAARTVDGPYMLAGGLSPDNLQDALDRLHPYAVDASSGVEDESGCKSAEKVAAFLRIARGTRA
jgi:phosphoribosylanthranilate isomerase